MKLPIKTYSLQGEAVGPPGPLIGALRGTGEQGVGPYGPMRRHMKGGRLAPSPFHTASSKEYQVCSAASTRSQVQPAASHSAQVWYRK